MDKVMTSAAEAVADIQSGSSLAVGGFGLCGVPIWLINALYEQGATDLETFSNNCGVDGWGLGKLLAAHRIRRTVSSYVGENKEFARQFLSGELEVELTPQGTLAERMRAGGAGIPAFFARTGFGTIVAEGKPTQKFDGVWGNKEYVMERAIRSDLSLVKAWKADKQGNLVYRKTARNFNPVVAMCGRVTIAEVEEIVENGVLDPDNVHTPGIFVQRLVLNATPEKRIENRTIRKS